MAREPILRTRSGRIALLAMVALDVFLLPVVLTLDLLPMRVGDLLFAATMLVAMRATGAGDRGRRLVLVVAFAAFGVQFLRFVSRSHALVIADAALSALAMGVFATLVLVDALSQDTGPDRLLDVILAYLLVGATFAFLFEAVNVARPGSLLIDGRGMTPADYIYFSVTTMTSVGFGDALPRTTVARALTMAEALTGQLYVAVLVARFASSTRIGRERTS